MLGPGSGCARAIVGLFTRAPLQEVFAPPVHLVGIEDSCEVVAFRWICGEAEEFVGLVLAVKDVSAKDTRRLNR